MSEPTPSTPEPTPPAPAPTPNPGPTPAPQGDPAELGDAGKKAIKAERDRANAAERQAKDLQAQIDKINRANESVVEKAQREAKEATEAATKATADALRYRVAAKHQISEDDAELFLTGTDEATLVKQAERLADRTSTGPKPDLSQGPKATPATGTPEQDFATFLGAQLSG